MDTLSTDEMDTTWAVTECADAALGDLRRTQRLVELATVLAQRPNASLPAACEGDRAFLKATYRLFDHAAIAPQDLLQSHSDTTLLRLSAVPLIFAVQNTTEVDWTAHPAPTGLGLLTHPAHRGLHVHTTLALTPERVPLGLLAQAACPAPATLTVQAPRRGPQAPRPAALTRRFGRITLRPPRHRARERLPVVPIWAVQVLEEQPPAGAEPVEWLLLTTVPVLDVPAATRGLDWYGGRWGMEVWHKILQSGCHIDARQLGTAASLERCLTVYRVIAWRIFYATMLSRTVPDLPCTVLLEREE